MFNVLYEPWMGVVDMDGNETLVGLRDYLVNAHLYKCSAENKQFAVLRRLQQRLAETFVMDIFGINIDTEAALINAGHFDADEIDAYIRNCENSGVSFDLFDENRPFMQTDKITYEKVFKNKASGPVAAINPRMGSGNNKVFFNNVNTLKTMILSEANQDEYNVEFTDEDQEKCDEVAKKFMQDNSDQSAEAMHASEKSVSNVLRLWTIEERVRAQIIKEADTEVTDEEAGQTTFNYAIVYKKEVDDPEKKAKELVDAMKDSTDFETAASNAKLTAQTVTFTTNDPEYDDYDKTMIENAEKLKDGECDTYENKDGNIVVLYMKAVNDKEATESHKDSVISQRKSDLYEDTVDGWKDDSQVIVNKMAWDSIKTDKNEVFTEKQTDDNTTANTTVDGDDSSTTVDVTADDGGDVGDVDISSGDSKEESESSNAEEENGDTDEADKDGEQEENTEKESSEK